MGGGYNNHKTALLKFRFAMERPKQSKWLFLLSWLAAAFAEDPYEYSECVRPSDTNLGADVFYQFKVYGLAYDMFNFKDYEGRIFFAVNVASF